MPIKKQQFIAEFAEQTLNQQVSLFLGAGGSQDAGYPSWSELFKPFANRLNVPINETTDYYRLAQYYSNEFGKSALRKNINAHIIQNSFKSVLIDNLLDVGFTNIWTTNFDTVLERNFENRGILVNKVFKDCDFSSIYLNKHINIFKMNGDINNPDGMITTQADYECYEDSHRLMLMFFKRELIASTFLFIGYSFKDHLVLNCLSEIERYLGETANCHFTILKKDTKDPYFEYFVNDLEQRYRIKVLLVEEYEDVPLVLEELNEKIRSKKVFISGAFRSSREKIENFSHAFSKEITKELFESDYRIVNGIGRRFGTHLIGYASEYLAQKGIKDMEKYLIVRPFVGNEVGSDIKKKQQREQIISQCGTALFLFGEPNASGKSGVMEEFKIACELHKAIIPIAYPKMVSEKIWQEVKNNITQYAYLEKSINSLTSDSSTTELAKLVVSILDSLGSSEGIR